MTYKIAIFSPDQHILYDLHTLNIHGVGGGITTRIRLAHTLASRGHNVSLFINCPAEKTIDGVHYHHWSNLQKIDTDIFISSTSGDGLDLTCLTAIEVKARLKILLVHGISQPKGMDINQNNWIYAPSNFICRTISENWGVTSNKILVIHRGVEASFFTKLINISLRNDPFTLVYAGHPSKGLDSAIAVLRILRQKDPRFSLHVFGGYQLWGEDLPLNIEVPGLEFHGLIGQRDLTRKMQKVGFSLNLQAREEPFGMVVTDSMRAGCIVLASPVGAYPELIQNGCNGFLIPGDHDVQSTREKAAQLILVLAQRPDYTDYIRRNAIASPLSWETIASAMEGHWDWALDQNQTASNPDPIGYCPDCGSSVLPLADGIHCLNCGHYNRYTVRPGIKNDNGNIFLSVNTN